MHYWQTEHLYLPLNAVIIVPSVIMLSCDICKFLCTYLLFDVIYCFRNNGILVVLWSYFTGIYLWDCAVWTVTCICDFAAIKLSFCDIENLLLLWSTDRRLLIFFAVVQQTWTKCIWQPFWVFFIFLCYSLSLIKHCVFSQLLFTGRQRSCKPCNSYRRKAVRPSVRLSVCLSVRHTLALSENDAS